MTSDGQIIISGEKSVNTLLEYLKQKIKFIQLKVSVFSLFINEICCKNQEEKIQKLFLKI